MAKDGFIPILLENPYEAVAYIMVKFDKLVKSHFANDIERDYNGEPVFVNPKHRSLLMEKRGLIGA